MAFAIALVAFTLIVGALAGLGLHVLIHTIFEEK